jgi:hypothetical protein
MQRVSGASQNRDRCKRDTCCSVIIEHRARNGPGSAAHHFVLRRVRGKGA